MVYIQIGRQNSWQLVPRTLHHLNERFLRYFTTA